MANGRNIFAYYDGFDAAQDGKARECFLPSAASKKHFLRGFDDCKAQQAAGKALTPQYA